MKIKRTGLGTTSTMWQQVRERLLVCDLEPKIEKAIRQLSEGKAIIVKRTTQVVLRRPRTQYSSDTSDIGLDDS